jgi:hypothetical protein
MDVLVDKEPPAVWRALWQRVKTCDEGVDDDEVVALRKVLEPGLVDHIDFGLITAMQGHHHWHRALPRIAGRDENLILAIPRP